MCRPCARPCVCFSAALSNPCDFPPLFLLFLAALCGHSIRLTMERKTERQRDRGTEGLTDRSVWGLSVTPMDGHID